MSTHKAQKTAAPSTQKRTESQDKAAASKEKRSSKDNKKPATSKERHSNSVTAPEMKAPGAGLHAGGDKKEAQPVTKKRYSPVCLSLSSTDTEQEEESYKKKKSDKIS